MSTECDSQKMQEEYNQTESNNQKILRLVPKHHCRFSLHCDEQSKDQASPQTHSHICQYNLKNDKSIIVHEATIFLQQQIGQISNPYYESNKKIIEIIKDYYQIKHLGQNRIKQKVVQIGTQDQDQKNLVLQNKQFTIGVAEFLKHSTFPQNLNMNDFLQLLQSISDIIQNIFNGDQGVAFLFYLPIFELENECIDPVVCAVYAYQYSMDFVDDQQEGKKQKKDDIKICLISLQRNYQPEFYQEYPDKLQQINLFVEEHQQLNQYQKNQNINSQNIYNVNLKNLNIYNEDDDDEDVKIDGNQQKQFITKETIYIVFKQFMKKIIKSFDPKIIIFTFKLEVDFIVDPKAFQFLSQKLGRICQSKLIIIPRYLFNFEKQFISFNNNIDDDDDDQDQKDKKNQKKCFTQQADMELTNIYQCILQSFRGCLRIDKSFVNAILPSKLQLIYVYELVKKYFVKCKRDKIYFQNQLKIFKLTQNINTNKKLQKSTLKNQEIEKQSFPLINRNNGITFIDIGEIIIDEYTQYYVDYKNQLLIFIDEIKEFATIIEFDQNCIKLDQYDIDVNFNLKQSTYFFDNRVLYKFYGIDSSNVWSHDVITYIFDKNSKNWNKFTFKQIDYQDTAKGFITDRNMIEELIQDRIAFSVTKNQLSYKALSNERQVSLLAVGGHYKNSKIYYQSLFQEFIFDFNELNYKTKLFRKSLQYNLWKECASPFIHSIEQCKILYFEGNGKYTNICPESKLLELKIIEGNKLPFQLQNSELTSKNINLFRQSSHLFSSKQMNVRNGHKGFKVLLINIEKQKQSVVDESCLVNLGKQKIRIFQLFTFQQTQQNKQINIDQENFYEKLGQNQKEQNQCLHLNWLQNLSNSLFFHFDQNRKSYLLYFRDSDNKKTSKRFRFEDQSKPHEPILYPDYEELATVDWIKQQLIVVRRPNNNEINIYDCPFVNLQDVKDTKDDIMTVVQMNKPLEVPLDEPTQLISISIHEQCIFIITTTVLIEFPCDLMQKKDRQINYIKKSKINQILYNSQMNTASFKFKEGLLGFFYSEGMSNYHQKSQNAIVFKYFYFDGIDTFKNETLTFIPGITLTPDSEATITSILNEQYEILIQITLKIKSTLHYYQLRCIVQSKIHIRNQYEIYNLEGIKPFKTLVGNQSKGFIAYLDLNYDRQGL